MTDLEKAKLLKDLEDAQYWYNSESRKLRDLFEVVEKLIQLIPTGELLND